MRKAGNRAKQQQRMGLQCMAYTGQRQGQGRQQQGLMTRSRHLRAAWATCWAEAEVVPSRLRVRFCRKRQRRSFRDSSGVVAESMARMRMPV